MNFGNIQIMKYENIIEAKFISRPNRFIAEVEIDGKIQKAHVKNTGRCKELLVKGATVLLEDFEGRMGTRKMRYSLIGVEKVTGDKTVMINMDSQAPNKVVKEALENNIIIPENLENVEYVKGEYTYGNSRMDFYVRDKSGKETLIEVKGVTLENAGVAAFPDAPTQRGIKHIDELIKAKQSGYGAAIVFVIQMKGIHLFVPNYETHPEFGEALKRAKTAGVEILAYDCIAQKDTLTIDKPIKVEL